MKYGDEVKVIAIKKSYVSKNLHVGDVGYINLPEIRSGKFDVSFDVDDEFDCVKQCMIAVEDLELVKSSNVTDEQLLSYLPKQDPRWWCKVEDGYILNLKGERKNKIPYDYNS